MKQIFTIVACVVHVFDNKYGRIYLFFIALWLALILIACEQKSSAVTVYTYTIDNQVTTDILWTSTGSIWYGTGREIITRESDTGELVNSFDFGPGKIIDLGFSPDSSKLAILYDDAVILRDITLDQTLWQYDSPEVPTSSMAWSPDGKWLTLGLEDGIVILLDAQIGGPELTLTGLELPVIELEWSQAGAKLLGAANDTALCYTIVWNTNDGSALAASMDLGAILDIAWVEDQALIANRVDKTLWLWDAETGETELSLGIPYRQNAYTTALIWSPDGSLIATISSDDNVSLWQTRYSNELLTIENADARKIAWSPDSTQLLVLSKDKTITIWEIFP